MPALDALLSGVADIPPQGARYDLAFQGPIVGQRLLGTVELTDYIHVRPDGRVQLLHLILNLLPGLVLRPAHEERISQLSNSALPGE